MATRHRCLAVCAPGLEALLLAELKGLGITCRPPIRGGVPFNGTTRQLYSANVWSRVATRVLVRLEPFTARTFAELEQQAWELPWHTWLEPGSTVRIRVTSRTSRLYHTTAIAERLARLSRCVLAAPSGDSASAPDPAQAKREQAKRPKAKGTKGKKAPTTGSDSVDPDDDSTPAGADPAALMVVLVDHNKVSISIDASGEPLYRRGWRPEGAKAPLRESLAAAALTAVGWDGSVPLLDPFCGSGTIPIEAAMIAADLAPGRSRDFAFQRWPSFEPGTWASVRADVGARAEAGLGAAPIAIAASDRDAGAIATATANAARAGVADRLAISHAAVSDADVPGDGTPGWIVANPPWGGRISGGGDLRDLYAQLGNVARERFEGWSVAMWVADTRIAGHSGLKLEPVLRTNAGGRDIALLAGPVR